MRVLVDTHCWLFGLTAPQKLSSRARRILIDGKNEVFLSVASAWEIAIKTRLGKLTLPEPAATYIPSRLSSQGITVLPIQLAHTLRVSELPTHHSDPFDRLLVAQAQIEDLRLLTADSQLRSYDVELIWAG